VDKSLSAGGCGYETPPGVLRNKRRGQLLRRAEHGERKKKKKGEKKQEIKEKKSEIWFDVAFRSIFSPFPRARFPPTPPRLC
jgi:hypothetical protein